jgi:cytochrome c oxidase assembly protein subunit 15
MPSSSLGRHNRAVGIWLLTCAAFVLAMVVVGGLTRLTRSGLSIVEWAPITGVLPPLGHDAWMQAFAAYKATPEGSLVNAGMDLDGFQQIFLVEWAHRLLGRLTGFVVFIPLVFFLVTRRLSGRRALRLFGIFALGGLQGFIGWYMVKSGLVDEPRVSHYRLTLHLGMALAIFSLLLWSALDELSTTRPSSIPSPLRPFAWATLFIVAVTVAWGGFMAGLHAGHVAPTFPDMNGMWIPTGMFIHSPWWLGLFENALTVHFVHRTLAYCAAAGVVVTFVAARMMGAPRGARIASALLLGVVGLQVTLGALTVLHHVPIALAALHQLNAALLLGCAVSLVHTVRKA